MKWMKWIQISLDPMFYSENNPKNAQMNPMMQQVNSDDRNQRQTQADSRLFARQVETNHMIQDIQVGAVWCQQKGQIIRLRRDVDMDKFDVETSR